MNKSRKYLSDIMKSRELFNLNVDTGRIKLIVGGTGIGKSQFIIGKFINRIVKPDINKKVLLLANRSTLVAQHKADVKELVKEELLFSDEHLENSFCKRFREICGNSNIKVRTYHSFSGMSEYALDSYDTIIYDEAHFIIQDGTFNDKCDLIFKRLMNLYKDSKNIIMITATEFELLPTLWLNEISEDKGTLEIYDYNKVLNWYDRIDMEFTSKKLEDLIKLVPEDEKALIFTKKSKSRIKSFAESLENADYMYSRWDNGNKDKEMEGKQNLLIKNKCFDSKYLIANSAIDNGVSINDEKLTSIILDNIYDMVQIIQMIGRKRFNELNENDRLKVFVITNHSQVKKDYDKVLFELKLYNDYLDLMENIKEYPEAKEELLLEFNNSNNKVWEDKYIHVIGKDTSGINARFFVRECYLAKIGFQKETFLKLNEISFEMNDLFNLKYGIQSFRNVNYQFAKHIVERYDKSISDVVIDKGKMLKTIQEKQKIQKAWNNDLIPYLESFIDVPLIYGSDEHKVFINELYNKYDIGNYRGDAKPTTINRKIKDMEFVIKTNRKTIDKVKKTIWNVIKL
ncbi:DEAD/DEAH box helicase family protein [Clostridium sp. LQ25]|uniref:DEAD/DEAH box helicase family protein n=1 Tax=Clostridium sp. LQ25 TaxID=2992805 RepID=UPI00224DF51B|nr:DEAD/DEAH box helicase family protein [Clostridium sp. LQ25]UZT06639.1 DEAD/DEAH box helicase family protein [Clostridium sp. LQ25]